MKKDLISIIVPCYKPSIPFLKDCIDSVINQTTNQWELLIIYDGDNEQDYFETDELIKSFHNHNIRFYFIKHAGQSSARNFGIQKANGEYITFLDCDDALSPLFIETSLKYVKQYPNLIINYRIMEKYEELDFSSFDFKSLVYSNSSDFFFGDNPGAFGCFARSPCAKIYPRPFMLFDSSQPCIGEDVLYLYNCSTKFNFACVDFKSYFYRMHESSTTHKYEKKYIDLYLNLIEKQVSFAKNAGDKWISYVAYDVCKSVVFTLFRQIIFNNLNSNKYSEYKRTIKSISFRFCLTKISIFKINDFRKKLILFLLKIRFFNTAYLICKIHY